MKNYTCYSYILIVPKEVLPLINCTKFLAFSIEEEYEKFVKKNKCLFIWNISEKKNIIRFIDNLCKSGKLLIIRKTKYVYHVRKDKKTITRLITEEPQPLGRFIQKANEEYTFEVINPNLKNVIMEMANKNINFANGENMLRREKK